MDEKIYQASDILKARMMRDLFKQTPPHCFIARKHSRQFTACRLEDYFSFNTREHFLNFLVLLRDPKMVGKTGCLLRRIKYISVFVHISAPWLTVQD